MSQNKSIVPLGILGVVSSLIHGMVIPSMGIHVARILSFNLMYAKDPDYYSSQIKI
jgi:hypothetical protein